MRISPNERFCDRQEAEYYRLHYGTPMCHCCHAVKAEHRSATCAPCSVGEHECCRPRCSACAPGTMAACEVGGATNCPARSNYRPDHAAAAERLTHRAQMEKES